jgi:hypothetical protein
MSYDLAGNPTDVSIAPRQRARRAKPLDPFDPKTWHENEDLAPRLKARLRLGQWVAWHIRKQGDRAAWGDERKGARRAGIIEAVPMSAAWGVLDWVCVPVRDDNLLWIELKAEKGKLTEAQAIHALMLAKVGQEVAILRPRHFIPARTGETDLVAWRLIQHKRPTDWGDVLVQADMALVDVMRL